MEENQRRNGSFAIGLCMVTMIILIIALGFIVFTYRNDISLKNAEIEELKTSQKENEEKINELQDKINSVGNIVNDTESNDNQEIFDLPSKKYYANEATYDSTGFYESDCNVELFENDRFSIYIGAGIWYKGKYEKENNIITCKIDTCSWDGGGGPGVRNETGIIKFKIINENTLELISIKTDSLNHKAFSIGNTFSPIYSEIEGIWNSKASYSIEDYVYYDNKLSDILGTSYLEYGSSLTLNSGGTFEDKISPIVEGGTAITGTWEKLNDEEKPNYYNFNDNIKLKYSDGKEKILKVNYEEDNIINIEYEYYDNCYIILKK